MDTLIDAWIRANKLIVDYPLIALLVTALLSSLSFLFPRVREGAKRFIGLARDWFRERLHSLLQTTCSALGLARQKDLDRLRKEFEAKLGKTDAPAQTPPPRTIQRFGVKIRLDQDIWRHLGISDPIRITSDTIDKLVQGPFCAKCSYTLSEWNDHRAMYLVDKKCPGCKHQWTTVEDSVSLREFKNLIYKALDAEMQQTDDLKDSDGRERV
jgi:hypothetical protein